MKMLIIAAAAMAGGAVLGFALCWAATRLAGGNRKAAARLAKAAEKKMGTMDKVLILEALGVINSPDYWADAAEAGKVQYLGILLEKAAQTITKAKPRTGTPQEGVAALVAAGVINTPDYWLANYDTFPSLDLLLCALGGAVK